MQEFKLEAFKRLHAGNAEDMLLLSFALLGDSQAANQVVEKILGEVWDAGDFEGISIGNLFARVRAACTEVLLSYV